MLIFLIKLINLVVTGFTILIFVYAVMSWVVSPFHPARQFVDRLLNPMLDPIRRRLPMTAAGLDFSPMILLIAIQILGQLLIALLSNLF